MPITVAQKQNLKVLGRRVKALRIKKGFTLKELAYSIGKDYQSIYRLESGSINPSYIYLLEVSRGLDIDISELLNDMGQ